MAYKSRVNGLNLKTGTKAASGSVDLMTNMGTLGAKVQPLKPSNNPGPATSPSAQAAEPPKTAPSKTKSLGLPSK